MELKLGKPIRGEFEEPDPNDLEEVDSTFVGADVTVAVLALHPFGHATNVPNGAVANVSQCVPISFFGLTDDAGIAKLCFIPADINKIQVSETERFHGLDRQILKTEMADVTKRSTDITLTLTPKAQAAVTVHVFALPETLPESDDTGLIDWSAESRQALPRASVELTEQKDGGIPYQMDHVGEGRFVVGPEAQAEGFVCLKVTCEGYKSEERFVMLLVGSNEFYIPLQRQI